MTEPVNLSRERWEMLREALTAGPPTLATIVATTVANRAGHLTVHEPLEIRGIIFLPAEYVPGGTERVAKTQRFSPPPCA